MQAVIPIMRAQGGGAISDISSMLSKMYLPQLVLMPPPNMHLTPCR